MSSIWGSIRYLVDVLEASLVLKSFFFRLEGTLAFILKFIHVCLLFCSKEEGILLGIFLFQPVETALPELEDTLHRVEEEESTLL